MVVSHHVVNQTWDRGHLRERVLLTTVRSFRLSVLSSCQRFPVVSAFQDFTAHSIKPLWGELGTLLSHHHAAAASRNLKLQDTVCFSRGKQQEPAAWNPGSVRHLCSEVALSSSVTGLGISVPPAPFTQVFLQLCDISVAVYGHAYLMAEFRKGKVWWTCVLEG